CLATLLSACRAAAPGLAAENGQALAPASAGSPLELRNPHSICVTYRDDAEHLPLPTALVAPVSTAHQASNPILRPRSGYEAVTDSIAMHFGLEIHQQVYYGRVLMAGFGLPEGTDGDAL